MRGNLTMHSLCIYLHFLLRGWREVDACIFFLFMFHFSFTFHHTEITLAADREVNTNNKTFTFCSSHTTSTKTTSIVSFVSRSWAKLSYIRSRCTALHGHPRVIVSSPLAWTATSFYGMMSMTPTKSDRLSKVSLDWLVCWNENQCFSHMYWYVYWLIAQVAAVTSSA